MSHWGILNCLKYYLNLIYLYFSSFSLYQASTLKLAFSALPLVVPNLLDIKNEDKGKVIETKKTKILAHKRIGPHNIDILSIIWGGLLGDAHGERRPNGQAMGKGATRITFQQEATHLTYGLWLYNQLSSIGYCSSKIPIIQTRLGKGGVVRKLIRFRTWSYTSFNWIQETFYPEVNPGSKGVKVVPVETKYYLTPLALAIWIMDDGAKVGKGLKFCTNSFSYKDCLFLSQILFDKYGLKSSVHNAGALNQYNVYIWKQSMPNLREIVSPYMVPSMKYKILD